MKRAQMEMMGLAIIVILISLGLLFAVRFIITRGETSTPPAQEFRTSELAANFLNTLLETNAPDTECHEISFSTLYQDCANNPVASPPSLGGSIKCHDTAGPGGGPQFSCDYVNKTTTEILEMLLGQKKNYMFSATYDSRNAFQNPLFTIRNIDPSDCGQWRTKIQPLPSSPNPIFLWMILCEGNI